MRIRRRRPVRDESPIGPPPVEFDLDRSLRDYWNDRVRQHTRDRYAGLGLAKFPEDLRTYEHIMWAHRPNTVIEIGTSFGASALWFRDRLRWLCSYRKVDSVRVISIDLDVDTARVSLGEVDPDFEETIILIAGDVLDASLPKLVAGHLAPDARCMVVEDSAHEYHTTMAALTGFAQFVPPLGFFVAEDGYIDIEDRRPAPEIPRGVLPAVHAWLRTSEGRAFRIRRDAEAYGISSHPSGFLQRRH
jgi:cephalosporin hydroxylase